MRESEKREFKDEMLVHDFLTEEQQRAIETDKDVSNYRKEHTLPEYRRKDGD